MKDGTIGAAVFYVFKQKDVYILLNVYSELKRNHHLIEVHATEKHLVFPFNFIQKKFYI